MMTIWKNVEDLIENGFTIEQIVQLTGYPASEIKKVMTDWKSRAKTKNEEVHHDL